MRPDAPNEVDSSEPGNWRARILGASLLTGSLVAALASIKECSREKPGAAKDETVEKTRKKAKATVDSSIQAREVDPANSVPLKFNYVGSRDELFEKCHKILIGRSDQYADDIIADFAGILDAENEKKLREALAMGCDVSGVTSDDIAMSAPAPYNTCFTSVSLQEPFLFEGDNGVGKERFDIGGENNVPFTPILSQLDHDAALQRCHEEQQRLSRLRAQNSLNAFGIINNEDIRSVSYVAEQLGCEAAGVETYKSGSELGGEMKSESLVFFKPPAPYDKCDDIWVDLNSEGLRTEERELNWIHPRDRERMVKETEELIKAVREGRYEDGFGKVGLDSMRRELEDSLLDMDPNKANELRTVFEGVFEDIDSALSDIDDRDAVCKVISAFDQLSGLEPSDQGMLDKQYMLIWFFQLAEGYFRDYDHCKE